MTVKQKCLHSAFVFLSRAALGAALCLFGTGTNRAQSTAPVAAPEPSRVEWIGGRGSGGGAYVAGLSISMPPGSHTYWKMPGDAGVPPVFDFAGSRNLLSVHVLYPVPRRISEEGLEAFGYLDHVILPVEVQAADPTQPVEVDASVAYAVCNRICIPAKGRAGLTLTPGVANTDAGRVEDALAEVPRAATPPQGADLAVAREPDAAKPAWTLTWRGATPVEDIFADAPEGTYLATRKTGPATWRLVAEQLPHGAGTVVATLVLARAMHPLAIEERLDTAAASR